MNNNTNSYLYRDIVVLYCPQKTGSTTIVSSIRLSLSDKFCVYHAHNNKIAKIITNNGVNNDDNWITVDSILKNANTINPITGAKRKVYIIDIYRSSVERKISEYFQNLSEIHFNNYEEHINNYDVQKIINRFNNLFPHIKCTDYYKDVYNLPDDKINDTFDFENKYLLYESNGVTYVKLRLKDSYLWGNILTKILSEQIFIYEDYKSEDKKIGSLYKKFNSEYKIPANFFYDVESCPQLKFYYSDQERKEYLKQWHNKITNSYTPFTVSEYDFYMNICTENRFIFKNFNNHYADDGCLCIMCSEKRQNMLENIKKNNIANCTNINHPYDGSYSNTLLLNIVINNEQVPFILNVINY